MAAFSVIKIISNRSALRWWATLAYSMVIVQAFSADYASRSLRIRSVSYTAHSRRSS